MISLVNQRKVYDSVVFIITNLFIDSWNTANPLTLVFNDQPQRKTVTEETVTEEQGQEEETTRGPATE